MKEKKDKSITSIHSSPREMDRQPKWVGEYRDMLSFKILPVTEMFIERLAKDLIAWAQTDDAWIYSQFYTQKGIHRSQYYKWVDAHEVLREAHDMAKELIGIRRETKFQHDTGMVKPMMPFYSQDWKDMETWRNKLKVEQVSADKRPIILGSLQGVDGYDGSNSSCSESAGE